MAARKLAEEKVEASRVVEALQSALASNGAQLLDATERARIDEALAALIDAMSSTDSGLIKDSAMKVEKVCEFYVERRMNQGIKDAMSGHKVDEFQVGDV